MTERVFENKLFQKTIGKILTIKTRELLRIEDLKILKSGFKAAFLSTSNSGKTTF